MKKDIRFRIGRFPFYENRPYDFFHELADNKNMELNDEMMANMVSPTTGMTAEAYFFESMLTLA